MNDLRIISNLINEIHELKKIVNPFIYIKKEPSYKRRYVLKILYCLHLVNITRTLMEIEDLNYVLDSVIELA